MNINEQENYNHRFDDAMEASKAGRTSGIINIRENFSTDLMARFSELNLTNETLEGSTVHLYLDMTSESNGQIPFAFFIGYWY